MIMIIVTKNVFTQNYIYSSTSFNNGILPQNQHHPGFAMPSIETIVATYRSPFEERVLIDLDEYKSRVKQKNRDINIDNILK